MRRFAASLVLIAALLVPTAARACGPMGSGCWFTPELHPDVPLDPFAAGNLGIIKGTWARSYRVVAYRHLAGIGMDADQQAGALALWRARLDLQDENGRPDGSLDAAIEAWRSVRSRVGGAPELAPYKLDPESESWIVNCHADAFLTATQALEVRMAEQGVDAPGVLAWVKAQDDVFAGCSGRGAIPERLGADATALARADREYQIAAALMYDARHDEAIAAFEAIAADAASPWRTTASFLVARTKVRKAFWRAPFDAEAIAQAERALRGVLADPVLSKLHPSANRLLARCRFQSVPGVRLGELANSLAQPGARTLRDDLSDLTDLIDVGERARYSTAPAWTLDAARASSDLLDWTMSWEGGRGGAHALDRWRALHSLPWLVAALELSTPSPEDRNALLADARAVDHASPGWLSVVHGAARLLIASSREDEARAWLDDALARPMGIGARNALLAVRLPLARDEATWWRDAVREPAGCASEEMFGKELPDGTHDDASSRAGLIDVDAAQAIDSSLPLARLVAAAEMRALPRRLRRRLAMAAWVRAVLLDDVERGSRAAAAVRELEPSLAADMDAWTSGADSRSRRFAGALAILRRAWLRIDLWPGEDWSVESSAQRFSTGYCWWSCGQGQQAGGERPGPSFLSPDEVAHATDEWARLNAMGPAPDALARIVIDYAAKHPGDPREPEALHCVVRATRYGCTGPDTSSWSHRAFDLLHRRHPRNAWTRKTPYWF